MKNNHNENEIVFGKAWFDKHQAVLLWLLNKPIVKVWFRWVLRIRKSDCKLSEKIVRVQPNHYTVTLGKKGDEYEFRTDFRAHNKFAKRMYYAFKPVWYAMHLWDMLIANKIAPQLNFGFDTLTAYPATSGSPMSGYMRRNGVNESMATIRAGAGNGSNGYSYLHAYLESDVSNSANNFYAQYRSTVMYDTSSIADAATITAAVISFYGGSEWTAGDAFAGTKPDFHVSQGGAASESAVANGDYNQGYHGTTSFGSIATGTWAGGAYNDITMNASGIAGVSKTGLSKYSLQTSWDINNSFGGTWSTGKRGGYTTLNGVDQAGTSQDPKLVITYSVGGAAGSLLLLGVGT